MASRRTLLLSLLCVAAAIAGAGGGYYLGRDVSAADRSSVDLFTAAQLRYGSYLFAVRSDSVANAREVELRSYLAYLDANALRPAAANPNVYAFDKALAFVRLAQLAQSRKATADATRLLGEADAVCPSTGFHNCSANDLLFTVRERDRRAWGNSTDAPLR
jgi:hypothetical protein